MAVSYPTELGPQRPSPGVREAGRPPDHDDGSGGAGGGGGNGGGECLPWYWWLERALRAVTYYWLVVGQIGLMILIAFGVVGGALGFEALFWHEHWWSQFCVGLSVGWLFGTVLYINLLLLRPEWVRERPGDSKLDRWDILPDWCTLFPVANSGRVRRVGRWLFRWQVIFVAAIWGGKLIWRAFMPTPDGATESPLKAFLNDQAGGLWFGLGYLVILAFTFGLIKFDACCLRFQPKIVRMLRRRANRATEDFWLKLLAPGALGAAVTVIFYGFALYAAGATTKPTYSPAVIISLSLIMLDVVVGGIALLYPARLIVAACLVAVYFLPAAVMTLPHLKEEDKQGNPVALIDSEAPLKAHLKRWQDTGHKSKPRLVLIAVSGGGIRAAVWTAVVLEGLEKELGPQLDSDRGQPHHGQGENFREYVRMVTGASGGMVAAGAYAALDQQPALGQKLEPEPGQTSQYPACLRPFSAALSEDALSAVAQTMATRDFAWSNVPFLGQNLPTTDRGRRLEDAWNRNWKTVCGTPSPFDAKIRDLYKDEEEGKTPSVVFAPVYVEDTKRLLITNLNLSDLATATATRLDQPERICDTPARQFFREYPGAKDFTVATAARLNASFPVVSPAVPLPETPVRRADGTLETPTRRAVDGGYFDNYGLDLAARWLIAHKRAVVENTSGVVLIQIRAFPLEADGIAVKKVEVSPLDRVVAAVNAPAQAVLTARSWGAHHRNMELLGAVDEFYNAADRANPFFQTMVFELNQPAALSWYLTTTEKREVVRGFYTQDDRLELSDGVEKSVAKLKGWFGKGDGMK